MRPALHINCLPALLLLGLAIATPASAQHNNMIQSGNLTVHYNALARSEEHTSELQSLMRISYAVFCLKKKKKKSKHNTYAINQQKKIIKRITNTKTSQTK